MVLVVEKKNAVYYVLSRHYAMQYVPDIDILYIYFYILICSEEMI